MSDYKLWISWSKQAIFKLQLFRINQIDWPFSRTIIAKCASYMNYIFMRKTETQRKSLALDSSLVSYLKHILYNRRQSFPSNEEKTFAWQFQPKQIQIFPFSVIMQDALKNFGPRISLHLEMHTGSVQGLSGMPNTASAGCGSNTNIHSTVTTKITANFRTTDFVIEKW